MATKTITGLNDAEDLGGYEMVEVAQLSASVTITAATISASASDNSLNDSGEGFGDFSEGDRVNVTGFATSANNLFVGVVTAVEAGKLTIGGADGDAIADEAAGEDITIAKWTSRRATAQEVADLGGGGGDASYPDFAGNAGKALLVNEAEDGVLWGDVEGGGGSGGGSPGTPPTLVQKASLRGDGNMVLPAEPAAGNLLVLVMTGYRDTVLFSAYAPVGFTPVRLYSSDFNNCVAVATKWVESGDPASWAMAAADNQSAVMYEFSGASGVIGIAGGAMSRLFTGNNFEISVPSPMLGAASTMIASFTSDTVPNWAINEAAGLTVDYLPPASGSINHPGAYAHYSDSFDGIISGSLSGTPVNPAFGVFEVVGTIGSGGSGGTASRVAAFKAVRTGSNQSIPSSTLTTILFNTEVFDDDGLLTASEFIVPASLNGKFAQLVAGVRTSENSSAAIYIERNGTLISQSSMGGNNGNLIASGTVKLTTGDVFKVRVFHGASLTVEPSERTFFSGVVFDAFASGGGGGGGALFDPPAAADFTLVSGDATQLTLIDDADAGLIATTGNFNGWRMAVQELTDPTGDFDVISKSNSLFGLNNNTELGQIVLRDSVSGRHTTFGFTITNLVVSNYGSLTGFSGRPFTYTGVYGQPGIQWFRIVHTGGEYIFYVSSNGKYWAELYRLTDTSFLTNRADQVGFGIYRQPIAEAVMTTEYFSLTGPAV